MSVVLVTLFYFMKYAIYFIIGMFCLGGASCMTEMGGLFLAYQFPALKKKVCKVPLIESEWNSADLIAVVPALTVVGLFFHFRNTHYGWPFQDTIGCFFLMLFQRTLRLPDIRVASLLLSCMFFFDIFWVFISPLIFHRSVMVTVAKGGGTGESVPLLLQFPTIGEPLGGVRMLGFGDIAVPGLLVSYLLRYDKLCNRGDKLCQGYFLPAVIGYALGLCATLCALAIMEIDTSRAASRTYGRWRHAAYT
jgi:signal peptide peptidase-like protein 2B